MSEENTTRVLPEYPKQSEVLYEIERQCPICEKQFKTLKVRSRLTRTGQDADFCTYFKEVNPYYYSVWVCNSCGFAAPDSYFNDISDNDAFKIKKYLKEKSLNVDFSAQRNWEQALATYKLAIFFSELMTVMPSRIAQLYMKQAWIYRENGNEEEEKKALRKTAEFWDKAMRREKFPIGNLSETIVMYLIGEVLRRIGEYEQSLLFLSKVVFKRSTDEKQVIELAKEAWNLAKEAKKHAEESGGQLIEGVVMSGQPIVAKASKAAAVEDIDDKHLDEILAEADKSAEKPLEEKKEAPTVKSHNRPQRSGKLIFVAGKPLYLRLLVEAAIASLRRSDFTVITINSHERLTALIGVLYPDALIVVGTVPMGLQAALGDIVRKQVADYGMFCASITDKEWDRGSLVSFEKSWTSPFRSENLRETILQRVMETGIK